MATFGVLKGENPSQAACDCAQSMIETMEHINAQLAERGLRACDRASASPWVRSLRERLVARVGARLPSSVRRLIALTAGVAYAPSGSIC